MARHKPETDKLDMEALQAWLSDAQQDLEVSRETSAQEAEAFDAEIKTSEALILDRLTAKGIDTSLLTAQRSVLEESSEDSGLEAASQRLADVFYGNDEDITPAEEEPIEEIYQATVIHVVATEHAIIQHTGDAIKQRMQLSVERDEKLHESFRDALVEVIDELFIGDSIEGLSEAEKDLVQEEVEEEAIRVEEQVRVRDKVIQSLEESMGDVPYDDRYDVAVKLSRIVLGIHEGDTDRLTAHYENAAQFLLKKGLSLDSPSISRAMKRAYEELSEGDQE